MPRPASPPPHRSARLLGPASPPSSDLARKSSRAVPPRSARAHLLGLASPPHRALAPELSAAAPPRSALAHLLGPESPSPPRCRLTRLLGLAVPPRSALAHLLGLASPPHRALAPELSAAAPPRCALAHLLGPESPSPPRCARAHLLGLASPPRRVLAILAAAVALSLALAPSAGAAPPGPPGQVPPTIISPDYGLPPLESLGDGRLRFRGDGFTATVHPDGTVKFRDFVDRDWNIVGVRRRRLEPAPLDQRSPQIVDFEERAIFPMGRLPIAGVGGRFGGLADWTIGQKHVAAKRAFLDATAGLRYRLAYAWQRARAQEQLADLADRLLAVWRDPKLPLAERKRLLFALWDECDDLAPAAPSPFDVLRGTAGRNARLKIAAFVRLVAPPGTADAYTPDDLARLNATRRSVARFDPYLADASPPLDLPELPPEAAPDPPRDAPEPEPETYGPIPEPTVALPTPKPEPEKPRPKRERKDPYNRVKIGPINIPVGRK